MRMFRPRTFQTAGALPRSPHPPRAPGRQRRARLSAALGLGVLVCVVLGLVACGGPRPRGELLGIQDDQYTIADPGKIGASATGRGCGFTPKQALTSARRVAQFNLRTLTGVARYNVRYDPLSQSRTDTGYCVEVSATAVSPEPHGR